MSIMNEQEREQANKDLTEWVKWPYNTLNFFEKDNSLWFQLWNRAKASPEWEEFKDYVYHVHYRKRSIGNPGLFAAKEYADIWIDLIGPAFPEPWWRFLKERKKK